jgi:hypothetical protein
VVKPVQDGDGGREQLSDQHFGNSEQSMAEQILRCSGRLVLLKMSRARDELMPVGQDPPR